MPWGSIIGAGIGAASSLLGGRSKSQSSTQTNAPWGPQQPHLTGIFGEGQRLYGQGVYQGPYIAPWSPFSSQAANLMGQNALDPNSLVAQAQGQLGKTIAGDYLNVGTNPYLEGAVQTGLNQVRGNVSQQFGGENFGSSANQGWLAKEMSQYALPIYAQNYARERQNQLSAMSQAPGLQMANFSQLGMAGGLQDARGAQEIAAAKDQFYSPWDVLGRYQGAVTGNYGGNRTTTSPYYTNPWSSMLGGGIAGAQLGRDIYNNWPSGESYGDFMGRANEYGTGGSFTNMGDPAYG